MANSTNMIIFVLNKASIDIAGMLRQAKLSVWTSVQDVPANLMNNFSFTTLAQVDAIILELGHVSDELQFILAQSIILRKPTLCLYPKNKEPREILHMLSKNTVPKCIVTRCYTSTTIDETIDKFLQTLDQSVSLEQVPSIKFTVRLTPSLQHYLEWLAEKQHINKADYIRQLLKKTADDDVAYQQLFH